MGRINALARVAHAQEEGREGGRGSDSIDDLASSISISSSGSAAMRRARQIVIAPLSECTEGRGSRAEGGELEGGGPRGRRSLGQISACYSTRNPLVLLLTHLCNVAQF